MHNIVSFIWSSDFSTGKKLALKMETYKTNKKFNFYDILIFHNIIYPLFYLIPDEDLWWVNNSINIFTMSESFKNYLFLNLMIFIEL